MLRIWRWCSACVGRLQSHWGFVNRPALSGVHRIVTGLRRAVVGQVRLGGVCWFCRMWSHHEAGDELARLKLTEEFNVAVWGRKPLG